MLQQLLFASGRGVFRIAALSKLETRRSQGRPCRIECVLQKLGIPYAVMNTYHVIPFKADIAHLVILMGLTFFVSILYGTWRYR